MTPFPLAAKGVIFDLDGTLLDTLEDIAGAMNRALTEAGYPTHPLEAYRHLTGGGAGRLAKLALPEALREQPLVSRIKDKMLEIYQRSWHVKTKPYDGIQTVLQSLHQLGMTMAVLSNKPMGATRQTVAHYFEAEFFREVWGVNHQVPPKPALGGIRSLLRALELEPEACVFVGDSKYDMLTARGGGMAAVGVSWGFRERAELLEHGAHAVIDSPAQLLDLLCPGAPAVP